MNKAIKYRVYPTTEQRILFAKTFGCPVDEDALYDQREDVAEEINEILLHRLKNNIRFCPLCGKALPLHHRGRVCDACYRRMRK